MDPGTELIVQILATTSRHQALWLDLRYQKSQTNAQHFIVLKREARISYIPPSIPHPAINPCLTNEKVI